MAPSMEVIKVQVTNMMATSSMGINNEIEVNSIEQLSRELENSMKSLEQIW